MNHPGHACHVGQEACKLPIYDLLQFIAKLIQGTGLRDLSVSDFRSAPLPADYAGWKIQNQELRPSLVNIG